ncbi:PDI1 [Candida oxycetoniae]|uniref:protein disulfide-isomerase n=1 Tax=Candida oxycetoniae TaxID=497107 RepID=A0AAI9SWV7_9ASCO|nr:PDI1 [Candida oxycetoniae]KAI3404594.2 PDI1 [Candida oxycetoniae]
MQFWKYSTSVLATLLAVVSVSQAGGPTDGEAAADPNSAVVKLTSENFASFLEENPLVLTEFFAPWCGYCKILGPEFSKAADTLNESHPNIKLAQVDCTADEAICMEHEIKGYPTLKIVRDGDSKKAEDYQGPREHQGIVDYMIKQSLPAVQAPTSWEDLEKVIDEQTKPFVLQVNSAADEIFKKVANLKRKDFSFINVDKEFLKSLGTKLGQDLKKAQFLVVHPKQLTDAVLFDGKADVEKLSEWIDIETIPYFGDMDRDTYMSYMTSPLPIAYYFYKTPEQREAVAEAMGKLGRKYRSKLNIVGLDANLFGRHAEAINMNPEIVPLFAIQHIADNKKYGVNQTEHPDGPSVEVIEQFIEDYFNDKLTPIIKSEPLPTAEEIAANPVVKLVAHNYKDILDNLEKDIFVKYYAPWCGHCKKLAPVWEELAEVFGSNKGASGVIIADIDHTSNDVDVPYEIQGYPTLLLFPANGELDERTGLRKPIVFEGARDLSTLIDFVKEKGSLNVDGNELKAKLEEEKESAVVEEEKEAEKEAEAKVEHDEL